MDIESIPALEQAIADGIPLGRLRLQSLDLREHAALLTGRDVEGLVVLGGRLPAALARHLTRHGAVVLPPAPHAPVDPYRAHLYSPAELYAGLADRGYDATPDAKAYAWSRSRPARTDAYTAVLRATHDVAMDDALDELIDDRPVVGVMGGHALSRGEPGYLDAARLGHTLAATGLVVATGGGPGAMEAANLGAYTPDEAAIVPAIERLAAHPSFAPDVGAWAQVALDVLSDLEPARRQAGPAPRSVGIPTWFYGHEPPNVFCDGIAKFFSNAVREDGLLARCTAGVVVLPGAAGTVQEIFQAATPRYYAQTHPETDTSHDVADHVPVSPLVLVGREYWTRDVPVWDALTALGREHSLGDVIHLVDGLDEAAAVVGGS